MAESTYHGLTHSCDDPKCHVHGFVATLQMNDQPGYHGKEKVN